MKKFDTIEEATQDWVRGFNVFPQNMIEAICESKGFQSFNEITIPSIGNRVYEYNNSEYGEITNYNSKKEVYTIKLDNGDVCKDEVFDFEVVNEEHFPACGFLYQFDNNLDDYWLEEKDGIKIMSNLGFRIYYNEDWGYFFGIEGYGYNFYEEHWIPLYKAKGMHWHKEEEEEI